MNAKLLDTLIIELSDLRGQVQTTQSTSDYVYKDKYSAWIEQVNAAIEKINSITGLQLSKKQITIADLSHSQKTATPVAVSAFIAFLENVTSKIEEYKNSVLREQQAQTVQSHQMRYCFKLGENGCPQQPQLIKGKIFVAMPFSPEHKDSFEYGLKLSFESNGRKFYRADEELTSKDIMCKICYQIQTCEIFIGNISGQNANVMLEIGLAYGLGKQVILIKDKQTSTISDLRGIEYIEYDNAYDLRQKIDVRL